jgi:hypothetical protein
MPELEQLHFFSVAARKSTVRRHASAASAHGQGRIVGNFAAIEIEHKS